MDTKKNLKDTPMLEVNNLWNTLIFLQQTKTYNYIEGTSARIKS